MLPLARYRLHFTATTPVNLPDWAGSALRGAFGHALRQLACMTREKDCPACPLYRSCPYPAIFAPPPVEHTLQRFSQAPAPYLIEPAQWGKQRIESGQNWHVDLVLMGRALRELPIITLAWQRAAQRGLGAGDGQSQLAAIDYLPPAGSPQRILHAPGETLHTHEIIAPTVPNPETAPTSITLNFISPLRLQENGRALPPAKLDASRLLMALTRRLSLLMEFHGNGAPGWDFKQLKESAARIDSEKQLRWQDWTRRSSRQQQAMQLGGVIGHWTLRGDLAPFLPTLHLGQWLHVGKETVFGLGRYSLREPLESTSPNAPDTIPRKQTRP